MVLTVRRRRSKREIGGRPFGDVGPSPVAALAGAMVESHFTGVPATVPKGMSCEDVAAAFRIAESWPKARRRSGRPLAERVRKIRSPGA
jgi:hypothetical protein